MNVLIVRKPTNFELHGESVRRNIVRGYWHEEELQRLEHLHLQHYQGMENLCQSLDKHKISYQSLSRDQDWQDNGQYDAVIAFGGDGTLLSASHRMGSVTPLIGIRSSDASVGYLCAASAQDPERIIELLTSKSLQAIDVTRMIIKIEHLGKTRLIGQVPALNDVLFCNVNPAATSHYRIRFRGETELHKSSGIWLSTAIGSTAGILAAGGVQLEMNDRRMQFRTRELYTTATKKFKFTGTTFDPDVDALMVENRSENAILAIDGPHNAYHLSFGDSFSVSRGPSLRLVR